MKCAECSAKISATWLQTNEWKESHFCAKCLYGEDFVNQVTKACRQTRIGITPKDYER